MAVITLKRILKIYHFNVIKKCEGLNKFSTARHSGIETWTFVCRTNQICTRMNGTAPADMIEKLVGYFFNEIKSIHSP